MFTAHIVIGAAHHGALEGPLGTPAAHLGGDHLVVDVAALGVAHGVLDRLLAPRICKHRLFHHLPKDFARKKSKKIYLYILNRYNFLT